MRQETPDALTFFRAFLKAPPVVASAVSSSRLLEQRIVKSAAISDARLVVELGSGTGGTTRALLGAMPADSRLMVFETIDTFVEGLAVVDDPRLDVVHDCASTLGAALADRHLDGVDAVVSGIPFSTMPPATARSIIDQVSAALKPGGRFVAYQFTAAVRDYGRPVLGEPAMQIEWVNIPPTRVFIWTKPESE
ncbi:MAG: methyltransferase type 12 [Gammaproteobacteria bacterium]|nr:methyltransferase type 12 [Gammaproteobacteria bacterium]